MWRFDSAAPPVCNEIVLRGSTVTRATILISALVLSWPVMGAQVYATYEGTASIQIGSGGTKVTANGIDYWTTGTPPRRYQVLEISTDARKDRLADGHVLGSKSVAKRTREAGGDAVIFNDADTKLAGVSGYAANGYLAGRIVNRTTTHLIVVKYLEPQS